jgi:quercetin dioxygenase-like cupin family protein
MNTENEVVVLLGGPQIQFVTPLSNTLDDYCVMKATVPPGVVVPIHSHLDRETFFILSGEIQGLDEDSWSTFRTGDVFDIPSALRHAWRNVSAESASLLVVTTVAMGRFFHEIGRPLATFTPGPPSPEELGRFVKASVERGYWLGGPEDNAAVGIAMRPPN